MKIYALLFFFFVIAGNLDNRQPGKDINGDGAINSLDKDHIGEPNRDFLFSLNYTFAYNDFDLNVVVSESYGGEIFAFRGCNNIPEGILNVQKDLNDRWPSPGQSGAGYQARILTGLPYIFGFFKKYWFLPFIYRWPRIANPFSYEENVRLMFSVPYQNLPAF